MSRKMRGSQLSKAQPAYSSVACVISNPPIVRLLAINSCRWPGSSSVITTSPFYIATMVFFLAIGRILAADGFAASQNAQLYAVPLHHGALQAPGGLLGSCR